MPQPLFFYNIVYFFFWENLQNPWIKQIASLLSPFQPGNNWLTWSHLMTGTQLKHSLWSCEPVFLALLRDHGLSCPSFQMFIKLLLILALWSLVQNLVCFRVFFFFPPSLFQCIFSGTDAVFGPRDWPGLQAWPIKALCICFHWLAQGKSHDLEPMNCNPGNLGREALFSGWTWQFCKMRWWCHIVDTV